MIKEKAKIKNNMKNKKTLLQTPTILLQAAWIHAYGHIYIYGQGHGIFKKEKDDIDMDTIMTQEIYIYIFFYY